MDVMMGDLVLTQDEVNPVDVRIARQRARGDGPPQHLLLGRAGMFYMHVHGHGSPADLAPQVKPALDLIGKVAAATLNRRSWRPGTDTGNRYREDRADSPAIRRDKRCGLQNHGRPG